jgi:methionyl-tRNA formyltransferase
VCSHICVCISALPCGDGSVLEVLQLQPPTKKAMEPKAFFNGLAGKQLTVGH